MTKTEKKEQIKTNLSTFSSYSLFFFIILTTSEQKYFFCFYFFFSIVIVGFSKFIQLETDKNDAFKMKKLIDGTNSLLLVLWNLAISLFVGVIMRFWEGGV